MVDAGAVHGVIMLVAWLLFAQLGEFISLIASCLVRSMCTRLPVVPMTNLCMHPFPSRPFARKDTLIANLRNVIIIPKNFIWGEKWSGWGEDRLLQEAAKRREVV